MNRQSGFNIIELMVAIAIFALLLGIGVPGLQSMIQNNRLTSQINLLSTARARPPRAADKHKQPGIVCVSTDGADCEAAGSGTGWDDGWIVFVDRNRDSTVDLGGSGVDDCAVGSTTDCILQVQSPYPGDNTLTPAAGTADLLAYIGDGSVRCNTDSDVTTLETCSNSTTYYTLCDFRGASHAKGLSISTTGRVTFITEQPNGSALPCP
jgi:type IV fimbrial biogenesis protein FimT